MPFCRRVFLLWVGILAALLHVGALVGCGDDTDGGSDSGVNSADSSVTLCGNGEIEGSEECDQGSANSDTQPDACRTDCTSPTCGDGVTDTGEACDEGAANSDTRANTCRRNCRLPTCGDGIIDSAYNELCDNGASNADLPGAACRADCFPRRCGDGIPDLTHGEECDEGTANSDSAADSCRTTCVRAYCGDGTRDASEVCDDGNHTSGDGCAADCQSDERCGNGIVDIAAGEVCDDGNTDSGDGCSADCLSRETCGNGYSDQAIGERCDEGTQNSDLSNATCRTDCQPQRCGDAILDDLFSEVCDDGLGNSDVPDAACRTNCLPRRCGDGIVDTAHLETCDDTNTQSRDGCSAACLVELYWDCTGTPSRCGCWVYRFGTYCEQCIVYVDLDPAITTRDGSTWGSAYETIQEGLDAAHAVGPGCEVWVAEGTYHVYQASVDDTIHLPSETAIYGGFVGTETTRTQRNPTTHPTIIDGTQQGNPAIQVTHALTALNTVDATLDGFVVQHAGSDSDDGGGIYAEGSSLTLNDCTFQELSGRWGAGVYLKSSPAEITNSDFLSNDATGSSRGSGIYVNGSAPVTISDCLFENNRPGALHSAGGALALNGMNAPAVGYVDQCQFIGNSAASGGAISAWSGATLYVTDTTFSGNSAKDGGVFYGTFDIVASVDRCIFSDNSATEDGGAFYVYASDAVVSNSLFYDNTAANGGVFNNQWDSVLLLSNCTLTENSATTAGAIYNGAVFAASSVRNSILWNNGTAFDGTVTVTYSAVEGGPAGAGNIVETPVFENAGADDFRLASGSPGLDAADGDLATDTDLLGNPRFDSPSKDNTGVGTPGFVDMGSFERQN